MEAPVCPGDLLVVESRWVVASANDLCELSPGAALIVVSCDESDHIKCCRSLSHRDASVQLHAPAHYAVRALVGASLVSTKFKLNSTFCSVVRATA